MSVHDTAVSEDKMDKPLKKEENSMGYALSMAYSAVGHFNSGFSLSYYSDYSFKLYRRQYDPNWL